MRRIVALLVLALCALAARAEAANPITVATSDCRHAQQRPTQITLACGDANARLTGLSWSSWGGRVAVGRGTYRANDCSPNCASGHFRSQPATVRLSSRKSCPGHAHRYYLKDAVTAGGRTYRYVPGCPYG